MSFPPNTVEPNNSLSDELDLVRCLVLKLCQTIRLYGNL